jgi:chromosome segregation ATPase
MKALPSRASTPLTDDFARASTPDAYISLSGLNHPQLETSRLSAISYDRGSHNNIDQSLSQMTSSPALLSLSTMVDTQTVPDMTTEQESVLRKLFVDAGEEDRAPATKISSVLTEWVNEQKESLSTPQTADVAEQLSLSVASCSMPSMLWPQFARNFRSFVATDGSLSTDLVDSFPARQAAALHTDRDESQKEITHLREQITIERELRTKAEANFDHSNQLQVVQTRHEIESLNESLSMVEHRYNEVDSQAKQDKRKIALREKDLKERREENNQLMNENATLLVRANRSNQLQVEVDSLKRQLESQHRLTQSLHGNSNLGSEYEHEVETLRQQLALTTQQKDQLLLGAEEAANTIQLMKAALSEKDDLNIRLQLELADIGDELGHMKHENQQLETSLLVTTNGRGPRHNSGSSVETLDLALDADGVVSEVPTDEMKAVRENNALLQTELEQLRAELQRSTSRAAALEEEQAESKITIDGCNDLIKWLYGDLDRLKQQQQEETNEIEYYTGRVQELEDDLTRNHVKLDGVSAALTQAQVTASITAKEIEHERTNVIALMPALDEENANLRQQLALADQKMAAKVKEISTAQKFAAETVQLLQNQFNEMQSKANELHTRASEAQNRSARLEDENTSFRSDIDRLTRDAEASVAREHAGEELLQAKIAKLEAEQEELRAKEAQAIAPKTVKDLQHRTEKLEGAVDSLTAQRDDLKHKLSESLTRCHTAEANSAASAAVLAKERARFADDAAATAPAVNKPQPEQRVGRKSLLTVRRDATGANTTHDDQSVALTSLIETNHKLTSNIDYLFKRTKKLERELEKSKSEKYMHTEKTHTVVREPAKIYMLRRSRTGQSGPPRGLMDVTNSNNADYSLVEARSSDAPPQEREYRSVTVLPQGRYKEENI